MQRRQARLLIGGALALLTLLLVGRVAMVLYTDALWYGATGFSDVFWRRLGVAAVVQGVAAVLAAAIILLNLWIVIRRLGAIQLRRRYGNLEIAEQVPRRYLVGLILALAVLGGWWLAALQFGGPASIATLAWLRRVPWGVADPLFGNDAAFYVFSLPLYRRALGLLLLSVLWSAILVAAGYALLGAVRVVDGRLYIGDQPGAHFAALTAVLLILLGADFWLDRYDVLLEGTGVRGGTGFTDVNARVPGRAILAGLSLAAAGLVAASGWMRRWVPGAAGLVVLALAALVVEQAYPAFVQRFRVEPNEIAREADYIAWNLEFTRRAYGLDRFEQAAFPFRRDASMGEEELTTLLARLPLWDPEPLETNLNQTQAIFPYYRFSDVDYDRYGPPEDRHQVGISVREFTADGLEEQSRTWQTIHLNPRYLRGWGAVVAPAGRTSVQGEPVYWLQNLEPIERSEAAPAAVRMEEPAAYFGETTTGYSILVPGRDTAFAGVPGRDFPAGIEIGSLPRRIAFAWRFGEKNLLFSPELAGDSRVIFRRRVVERLTEVADFVAWDGDIYPVLLDGRIVWIAEGFTASSAFPLSRTVEIGGIGRARYLSNSVKATVDAVTGEMRIYAAAPEDPVLATFRRVFPDLVQDLDAMPEALRAHLRYSPTLMRVQAEILEEYHLVRPEDFFAAQDVWEVASEAGGQGVPRPYRPTFLMVPPPGGGAPEMLLMLPFVARDRQNMTALLVARNDGPAFGEVLLLELPRDQQVLGPMQVHSLVEQDPAISQQLSLWRQAGSDVDVGHLRIVPGDSSFVYVLPLFLAARETSIPELAMVVVTDGQNVSMAPSLAASVRALRAGDERAEPRAAATGAAAAAPGGWSRRALELMERAEERLRAGDWTGFGETWTELRRYLGRVEAAPPLRPPD